MAEIQVEPQLPGSEPLPDDPPIMTADGAAPGPGLVIRDVDNNQHLYVQPWHQSRLMSQFTQQPHAVNLEASSYGPIDRLLNEQFISARKFMIKPQGVFRKRLVERAVENMGQKTSYGGKGGPPELTPDFIIVKSSPTLTKDVILAIVEIKREGHDLEVAALQIEGYLERAVKERNVVGRLHGFLILGNQVYTYVFNAEAARERNNVRGRAGTNANANATVHAAGGAEANANAGAAVHAAGGAEANANAGAGAHAGGGAEVNANVGANARARPIRPTRTGPIPTHGPEFKHQLFKIARRYWDNYNREEWGTYNFRDDVPDAVVPDAA